MSRELTKSEKISLSTTEIAKRVRQQLKAEFKGYKFSVRTKYYSMGSSITVSLMKSVVKVKKDFNDLSGYSLNFYKDNHYTEDVLRRLQNEGYHQLNEYILRGEYKPDHWCNGVFLTEQGHILLKRVVQIADYYNYNDSDIQTDYYSVNFSFSLHLGKWDKPFIDGIVSKIDPDLHARIRKRDEEAKIHAHKQKEARDLKDKTDRLEADSHTAKSRRTVSQINTIMSATAIFDENGLEVQTPETRVRRLLELDEVRQAVKVKGIDWSKEILEL